MAEQKLSCRTCRWWVAPSAANRGETEAGTGECRRGVPQILAFPSPKTGKWGVRTTWPMTKPDHWCGEWTEGKQPSETDQNRQQQAASRPLAVSAPAQSKAAPTQQAKPAQAAAAKPKAAPAAPTPQKAKPKPAPPEPVDEPEPEPELDWEAEAKDSEGALEGESTSSLEQSLESELASLSLEAGATDGDDTGHVIRAAMDRKFRGEGMRAPETPRTKKAEPEAAPTPAPEENKAPEPAARDEMSYGPKIVPARMFLTNKDGAIEEKPVELPWPTHDNPHLVDSYLQLLRGKEAAEESTEDEIGMTAAAFLENVREKRHAKNVKQARSKVPGYKGIDASGQEGWRMTRKAFVLRPPQPVTLQRNKDSGIERVYFVYGRLENPILTLPAELVEDNELKARAWFHAELVDKALAEGRELPMAVRKEYELVR